MLKCTNNKLRLCLRISLKAIMKLQGCLSRLVLMYSSILVLAELESFKMEYANARLECNAADERANILASEVIGLEEKFVSLVHPSVSVDCSILHDCYESFAMYCLGRYLVACLGNQLQTSMQTSIQAEPDKQQHFVYFVHL
ncbi:uncharacterized protein [Gossypium hirsutum]|uniref:Uncharacterized protein isoform X2 n=1 Tax=Gossypium hirsutum TaxID=3635 RepID=A0A1U8JX35_GOSHI|nr:uncharacterized protein LOC107911489 isoform X2 [Gossypium hirsutum]